MKHPLFIKVKNLVSEERKIQAEILASLKEICDEKLYLEWGYSSLFALCTEGFGYSESAAQRRITTLKLTELAPEVNHKIATGSLTLTTAAQIHKTFKQMDTPAALPALIAAAENKSTREAETALIAAAKSIEPEFDAEVLVTIRINEEAAETMKKLRAHFSHSKHTDSQIIVRLGEKILAQKPAPLPAPVVAMSPRHIPAQTRRFIFQRDQTCTFEHEGRRCHSTHYLQLDHIYPLGLGGSSKAENLRLLCAGHNRLEAEKLGLGRRTSVRKN